MINISIVSCLLQKIIDMPIISVIIPVLDGQKTIKETIESILKQSFEDFELIVINAGSTDLTLFLK